MLGLKIEIWSDYMCPFCYTGKRNFERALKTSGLADKVDVQFKAFELDATAPKYSDQSMSELLFDKYGEAMAKAMMESMQSMANSVDLHYEFDRMQPSNTRDSHRLAKWAEKEGKSDELNEMLFHAFFTENKDFGDKETLLGIIEKIGLDRTKAIEVLESEHYIEEVKSDIKQAAEVGVRGVPFFVINGKYAISGSRSEEVFSNAILKAAEEEGIKPSLEMIGGESSGTCNENGCDI